MTTGGDDAGRVGETSDDGEPGDSYSADVASYQMILMSMEMGAAFAPWPGGTWLARQRSSDVQEDPRLTERQMRRNIRSVERGLRKLTKRNRPD